MAQSDEKYIEYRLTPGNKTMSMFVPFVPDVMFILNTSDGTLYLKSGSVRIPQKDNADIIVLPNSYYSFTPYDTVQEFGALLDGVTQWLCTIYFRKGLGAFKLEEINIPFPDINVVVPLNPMPDINIVADFTYVILP